MNNTLADLQVRTFDDATATTARSYPPERRLTPEQLATYLDRREYATHPWMTLVIAENDDDTHIAVIAEGPAEVVPLDDVPSDLRAEFEPDWVDCWIRLGTERVLSYGGEEAQP